MKASRFDTDLENLAKDISALVGMKKEWIQYHLALLDFTKCVKTFTKKVENLAATGYLLQELFNLISEPITSIKQKNNLEAHRSIQQSIIKTFTQYGTNAYKEKITEECLALPFTAWYTNQLIIESEPLLSLLLNAFLQKTKEMHSKKAILQEVYRLQKVAQLLIITEESLELI